MTLFYNLFSGIFQGIASSSETGNWNDAKMSRNISPYLGDNFTV
jgi:hypothetical protein